MTRLWLILTLACLLVACGPKPEQGGDGSPSPGASGSPGASPAAPPVDVVVAPVLEKTVSLYSGYTSQTAARRTVNVTAQVTGILEDFSFTEGAFVSRGQVLFTVDPRTYQANVMTMQANVEKAQANLAYAKNQVDLKKAQADVAANKATLVKRQQDVDRYKPLAARQVIPQQTYTNAVQDRDVAKSQLAASEATLQNTALNTQANISVAEAEVAEAQANLVNAQINLGYTTITSPIDGLIGQMNVNPGNLVQPGNPVLVTISESNPIYVDFSIAEVEYLNFRKQNERAAAGNLKFELLLADGSKYNYPGKMSMVGRQLDAQTGTLSIRTEFPNPAGLLRPGQFGKIRVRTGSLKGALLVDQKAVTEIQSVRSVWVLKPDNTVEQRNINVVDDYENYYVVDSGVSAGEKIVVEGVQKLKPGSKVNPAEVGK